MQSNDPARPLTVSCYGLAHPLPRVAGSERLVTSHLSHFEEIWAALEGDKSLCDATLHETVREGTLSLAKTMARPSTPAIEPVEPFRPAPDQPVDALPRISLAIGLATDASQNGESAHSPGGADLSVLQLIGQGGMGTIHLARQRSLGRDVAIKRVRADVSNPDAIASLLREARTTGRLEHPNIVPVHMLGVDDQGTPVLVMKRIEGVPWSDLLGDAPHPEWSRREALQPDRLAGQLQILMHVCDALDFAHARGVIHRDIKPANVMLGEFGEIYLLDWGVALNRRDPGHVREQYGQIVGTPSYMAPEMASGRADLADARTDVYLLGATLHELVTGTCRHDSHSLYGALVSAALSEPFAYDASVPAELAALCNAAMHHDREKRPANAQVFRHALEDFLLHRASNALAQRAGEALALLRAIPGMARREADALRGEAAWQRMSECRFGYMQALREWPGNDAARARLDECTLLMIERELAARNTSAARLLLKELGREPPEMLSRIAQLDVEISAEKTRDARARRDALEMDSSVSVRQRVVVMFLVLAASIYVTVNGVQQEMRTGLQASMREVLGFDAVFVAALAAGVLIGRKTLFRNRVSRRMTWLAVVSLGLTVASDALTWVRGGDSRAAGMYSMLVLGACLSIGSLLLLPGLWPAAVLPLAAAAISGCFPRATVFAVTLAQAVSLLLVLHQILEHAQRERH